MTMNLERVYERWERKIKAEGRAEAKAEGKAEGKAEAVLAVLESRGFAITSAQRKQVLGCTNVAQLDAWLRAARSTPSVKALLGGVASARTREK